MRDRRRPSFGPHLRKLAGVSVLVLLLSVGLVGARAPGATPAPPGGATASPGPAAPPLPTVASVGPIADTLVRNWSLLAAAASDPANPSHVLVAVASTLYASNEAAPDGGTQILGSADSGASWSDESMLVPANWSDPSSPDCGLRFDGNGSLAFAPNGTGVFVGEATPGPGSSTCVTPQTDSAIFASEQSAGGGWSVPVPVAGDSAGADARQPSVAVNPAGGAVLVAFTSVAGATPLLELSNLSNPAAPTTVAIGPFGSVHLAVSAGAPTVVVAVAYTGVSIESFASSDGGRLFGSAVLVARDVGLDGLDPGSLGSDIDALSGFFGTSASFAVAWTNSSVSPRYSVVDLAYGWFEAGTLTWGVPIGMGFYTGEVNFDPSIGVRADDTIAIAWLQQSLRIGAVRAMGVLEGPRTSISSISEQFGLSSVSGPPSAAWNGTNTTVSNLGNGTAILPTVGGFLALWSDLRSTEVRSCGGCPADPARNVSVFSNAFAPAQLLAYSGSAPLGPNVTISGALIDNGTVGLAPLPVTSAAESGVPVTLSAETSARQGTTTWDFAAWFGSTISASATITGPWSGLENLTACYVPAAGELCQAPGAPGELDVTVQPSSAEVTVDGASIPTEGGAATPLLSVGLHGLTVALPGYVAQDQTVTISSAQVTDVKILLVPSSRITGFVAPASANVSVNGTPLLVAPNGTFSDNVVAGTYDVMAAAAGYSSYNDPSVAVGIGESVALNIVLKPFGEIIGTVNPSEAAVLWGSVPVERDGDNYSVQVPAGVPVYLNGSSSGFRPATFGPFEVGVGQRLIENLQLVVSAGWVEGTVAPSGASVVISGAALGVAADGAFNVSEPVGSYTIDVSAPGFVPFTSTVNVRAGESTWANVSLVAPAISLIGPPLTVTSLLEGLLVDVALIGGLTALFLLARRGRTSPSGVGTAP